MYSSIYFIRLIIAYSSTGAHVWQLELYKCLFKGQVTSDVEAELAGYGDGGEGMIRKRRHAMYGVIDRVIEVRYAVVHRYIYSSKHICMYI